MLERVGRECVCVCCVCEREREGESRSRQYCTKYNIVLKVQYEHVEKETRKSLREAPPEGRLARQSSLLVRIKQRRESK